MTVSRWKLGDALEVGDTIRFLDEPHRITGFERDHLHAPRVAVFDSGWTIPVSPEVLYETDMPAVLVARVRKAAA